MERLVEFWNANGTALMTFTVTAVVAFATYLITKYANKLVVKLVNYFVGILVRMFGGVSNLSDVNSKFNELPFINDLKEHSKSMGVDLELKLVELKRKLLSPKLSEIERKVFQFEFDKLSDTLEGLLTEKTKKFLLELEELSKKENE